MTDLAERFIAWQLENGFPCLFRELTGFFCPGCGGTRAIKALLAGRPIVSFFYHPLILYCALVFLRFAGSYILFWATGKAKYRIYLENSYIYVGIAIIVINFLVKNFLLLWPGIDVLSLLPKV